MQRFKVTAYKDGEQVAEFEETSLEFYSDYGEPGGHPPELGDNEYDRAVVEVVDQ